MTPAPKWITPDWPAPHRVHAASSTRIGGFSGGPYATLNMSDYVADASRVVRRNRDRVFDYLHLPTEPCWLQQVHGTEVIRFNEAHSRRKKPLQGDAGVTDVLGVVCAVQTADCLPVLLCDGQGKTIAAVHAGWRGLAAGVIEAAVKEMGQPPHDLLAWLGPAIGPQAFEVGKDVRDVFLSEDKNNRAAFTPHARGKWFADLYALARMRLAKIGVLHVYGGGWCTYSDAKRFYSYRRDGVTGRMATMIWLE